MRFSAIRKAFISGILLIAPIGVTLWVLNFLVSRIGRPARDFFFPKAQSIPVEDMGWIQQLNLYGISFISFLLVLIGITLMGWFSRLLIGRWLVISFERMVMRFPFIKTVYGTVKQIIDTFSQQNKAVFQRVVLLQFPRNGLYAIGFLTGEGKGEVQRKTDSYMMNVFVPTTPNPTSGFLIMVPKPDVIDLDMTVAEGMKLIISGGAVVPDYPALKDKKIQQPAVMPDHAVKTKQEELEEADHVVQKVEGKPDKD